MAYDITHKNSTVAGTPPTASEIEIGEIAINAADADLYVKDTDGAVQVFKSKFTQSGTGAVARTVDSKLKDVVSVKDFGAVGDGVTNDTAAIQAAIDYCESLVTSRFKDGATVFFPSGRYLIASTLTVSQSGIGLTGESASGSVLVANNSSFDFLFFDGSALALYNCGIDKLRFHCTGSSVDGAQIRLRNVYHSYLNEITLDNFSQGLVFDGCGKIMASNIQALQTSRVSGTPSFAFNFLSTDNINSDIHITNFDIFYPPSNRPNYSVNITGCDGLYFSSGHLHGGVNVAPDNVAPRTTCASMFWDTVYFDQSDASQFAFTGAASTAYRGFNFSNCYFRDSPRGMVFGHTGTLTEVRITGCTFYTHEESAVIVNTGSAVDDIHIVGTTFRDNNTNNSASQGDVILIGNRNNVIGCKFLTGGANGNAVKFATGSIDCLISDCDLVGSSATVKIANSGSQTKFGTLTGVNYKKIGSATIPSGGTSITVTHGMSATPNLEQILVTPRTSFSSGTSFWVSNLTATTFDINCATTSTGIVFTWLIDMTV